MRTLTKAPPTAIFGMAVVVAYAVAGLLAPWLTPYGQAEVVGFEFEPWGGDHLLGTDNLGRSMLTRLLFGIRNSVSVAVLTTLLAFSLGGAAGLLAAALGGWTDQILSRIVDTLMAIPAILFALLLLTVTGTGLVQMVLVIALVESTRVFRLARATAMNVMVMDYVEAARLRGEGTAWIVRREVLPNISSPLMAEFGLRFCFVFLAISALSFLGLGLQPPTADLGAMVRDNAALITFGDMTPLLPAAAIALLTVAVNFIVDWMLHRASGLKT